VIALERLPTLNDPLQKILYYFFYLNLFGKDLVCEASSLMAPLKQNFWMA